MKRQLVEETRHFRDHSDVHLACGHVLLLDRHVDPKAWLDKVDARRTPRPSGEDGISIECQQCQDEGAAEGGGQ